LAGADIYLTKPTRADEVLAVLRNLLLRLRTLNAAPQANSSAWMLCMTEMRLNSPNQEQLQLNLKETLILKRLSESTEAVAYQSLIDSIAQLGGDTAVEKSRLEVIVSRLRTKLVSMCQASIEIKTAHKIGFQLSLPLVIKSKAKKQLFG
jgi:DNA-binding response OmpR family regulator